MMNMKFIFFLFLFTICNNNNVQGTIHQEYRDLAEDIQNAQYNITELNTASNRMFSNEMFVLSYINDIGQYDIYVLYGQLHEVQVSREDIITLRNKTEATTLEVTKLFPDEVQNARNMRSSSGEAWFALDNFNPDILPQLMAIIEANQKIVYEGEIMLENEMKRLKRELKINVDAITGDLTAEQLQGINNILEEMNSRFDGYIEMMTEANTDLVVVTQATLASIQLVLDQLPK